MSVSTNVGQCCALSLCNNSQHALNKEHACNVCKKVVHVLCSVSDSENDDRIRKCLLCNRNNKSVSRKEINGNKDANEQDDESPYISFIEEKFVTNYIDDRVWETFIIKNNDGELEKRYENKFTKKMIKCFPQECYGRHEDEHIKQWTAQVRSTTKEGSKKREDKNTSMDDFISKAKKSKQGADTEEILMNIVDTDAKSELISSRLEKYLQKIEEKATSVDYVSKMNDVDAEFIPSYYKKGSFS